MKWGFLNIVKTYYRYSFAGLNARQYAEVCGAIFILPSVAGLLVAYALGEIPKGGIELVVSAMAILSALLFSAQFSLFSVVASVNRERIAAIFSNRAQYKETLRFINVSISYLILVAVSSVSAFVLLHFFDLWPPLEAGILVALLSHFLISFLILLPRTFDILDFAYKEM